MKHFKPFSFFFPLLLVLSLLLFVAAAQSPPPRNTGNVRHHHHHGHGHGHRHHRPRDHAIPSPPPPVRAPLPPPPSVPVPAPQHRHRHQGHVTQVPNANGVLVKGSVVVDKNGGGNFTTIGEAVAVAPFNLKAEDGYFVIYIKGGVYEEYITIPSHMMYIMFVGDGMNSTVITGNRNAHQGLTGYHTATVVIEGDGFVATGVTIRNTAGPENAQAVALRNNANRSAFFRCSIEGYQDTLYAHSGQQFYRECNIYGTVDFIYGEAIAVFQKCSILARRPLAGQGNVLTAQGRENASPFSATVLQGCTIDATPELLADTTPVQTYLGRPWKQYATVVVMQSYVGALVEPAGWSEMDGPEGLDTLFYGEYANYGPRADTRQRVRWPGFSVMNANQAAGFTVASMMQGDTWLPQTKIPFYSGLTES